MTFASWEVDYLKYDNCPSGRTPSLIISRSSRRCATALDGTGRADRVQRLRLVVLRMGDARRPPAADDDRHQQRSGLPSSSTDRGSIMTSLKTNSRSPPTAAPTTGTIPTCWRSATATTAPARSPTSRYQSHFSLWAIMRVAAHRRERPAQHERDDQGDPDQPGDHRHQPGRAGAAGRVGCNEAANRSIWAKPLNENGARAVVLLNEGAADRRRITVPSTEIGLGPAQRQGARSAGARRLGNVQGQLHRHRPLARHRHAEDRRLRAAPAARHRLTSAS